MTNLNTNDNHYLNMVCNDLGINGTTNGDSNLRTEIAIQYHAAKKKTGIAYLWYFLFGGFGAYKLYLRQYGQFMIFMILIFSSFFTSFLTLGVLAGWLLVDLFLIPTYTSNFNKKLAREIGTSRKGSL